MLFEPLIDAVLPIRTPCGQRRMRPAKVHADTAQDSRRCRRTLTPASDHDPHRARESRRARNRGSTTGCWRATWPGYAGIGWLSVQYARRADIHQASATVGCTLICFNHLQKGF